MSVVDGLTEPMVEALLAMPASEWIVSYRVAPLGTIGALESRHLIESRLSARMSADFDVRLTREGRRRQEAIAATR